MSEGIDHEARHTADMAMQSIRAHEDLCGERWEQSRKAADTLSDKVESGFREAGAATRRLHERIDKILWTAAGELMVLLVGAIATLTFYLLTRGDQ